MIKTINLLMRYNKKKNEMMLEGNLSKIEDDAKTLSDTIHEVIDDLQTAVYISHRTAGDTTHELIVSINDSMDTIRKVLKGRPKYDEMLDISNRVNEIKKAINKLQNIKPEPFEFITSEAENEVENLVDTIKKVIGLSTVEQDAKKLLETIREAIDAQQKNQDQPLKDKQSEAKELAEELVKYYTDPEAGGVSVYKAKELAEELVKAIQKAIKLKQEKDDKELKEFLEFLYPIACITYAYTLLYVHGDKKIDDAKSIIERIEPSTLTYGGRYNLACYYSIVGEKTNAGKATNAYTVSLCHLEYALERKGEIVEWANKDPDLKGVRDDESTKEDFAKLIKKYSHSSKQASAEKLPLAGLMIIGETYANQLKEQGIISPCNLILNANTHSSREALAKKLGINTQLLLRWAHLADLIGIVGDAKQVNLLEAAGFGSIETLKNVSNPCELTSLLEQVNRAESLVDQPPAMEAVQKWVHDAKRMTRKCSSA